MTVDVTLQGLKKVRQYVAGLPDVVDEAASFAVNEAARFGQAESSRRIREQVAFSAKYIGSADDPNSRLRVAKRAKKNDLTAVIAGRVRPTSLAQFVQGEFKRGRPVRVRVSPGSSKRIRNAFPIKLRRGTGVYDPGNANQGLAIRLKEGEVIQNKKQMVQLDGNLYLLYGPSVDQVFRDVRYDVQAPIGDVLESSFLRNFGRLSRGK